MVTDSELSDHFSLDTVGSHGFVKCKSHKKEYQVSCFIVFFLQPYFCMFTLKEILFHLTNKFPEHSSF